MSSNRDIAIDLTLILLVILVVLAVIDPAPLQAAFKGFLK